MVSRSRKARPHHADAWSAAGLYRFFTVPSVRPNQQSHELAAIVCEVRVIFMT